MPEIRLLPRSTRWRVALLSALTSLLVLSGGSFWFISLLRDGLENAAHRVADDKLFSVQALLNAGVPPADVAKQLSLGSGFLIRPGGQTTEECPPSGDAPTHFYSQVVVYSPDCAMVRPFGEAGQVYTSIESQDGKYFIIVAEFLDPVGLDTVNTAEHVLWGGVPGAALLIGVVAWSAVRRSLRAVGGIRAEVDGVRARDLGRRVPVPDSGDEITELAVTMNDMLARLDQSVQRQSQFTADASHELRTPLASIRTQLEVLLAHPERIDWQAACANTVLDVTRMQALTADLLLLSKLDAGQPSEREPVAMSELVTEHLAARTPRAGVRVDFDLQAMPVVDGHAGRLDRVLRNLVDNAEQYAESMVTVKLSASDGQCVLIVTDDGPGIPAADRERVFDRFVRLDEDRSRDEGGSGLGLAIASEIAREHGGTLAVTDAEVGARMELRLPLS